MLIKVQGFLKFLSATLVFRHVETWFSVQKNIVRIWSQQEFVQFRLFIEEKKLISMELFYARFSNNFIVQDYFTCPITFFDEVELLMKLSIPRKVEGSVYRQEMIV